MAQCLAVLSGRGIAASLASLVWMDPERLLSHAQQKGVTHRCAMLAQCIAASLSAIPLAFSTHTHTHIAQPIRIQRTHTHTHTLPQPHWHSAHTSPATIPIGPQSHHTPLL